MTSLSDLQARLGHTFRDEALLSRALTHSSAASLQSNERLEFLGDRVLGLIIAEALFARHPDMREGDLALRLNALVRREACADMARESGIGDAMILAPGERNSGGQTKPAILSDACEAVIAALYLDGGLDAARQFVLRFWTPLLQNADLTPSDGKTALQEWSQSRPELGRALPVYRQTGRKGPDHAPVFTVEVSIAGAGQAEGTGATKREAEQAAAAALLANVKARP